MLTDQVLTNVGQFWPILTDSCQISRKFDINYLLACLYLIFYICSVFILSQNITFKIGLYVTCLLIFLFSRNHFLTAWQRGGLSAMHPRGRPPSLPKHPFGGFPILYTHDVWKVARESISDSRRTSEWVEKTIESPAKHLRVILMVTSSPLISIFGRMSLPSPQ